MKKIFLFLCAFALALSAAAGFAYNINVTVGGVRYTGRTFGNGVEYRVGGKVAGYAKTMGGVLTYTAPNNAVLGTVRKVGNRWEYRDARNAPIARVEELGGRHTYKSANGSVIGYAVPLGGRTEYRAGNNATIGSADTNTLPFRPIPLENYLKRQKKAPADGVCLTRITKLRPGGQAIGAGLQPGDFLITFAGKDWTIFDLLNASYEVMRPKVVEKVKATLEDDHLVMIVYRPAAGERDHAGGAIVSLAPMNPGMKGYTYVTATDCEYYTVAGSKKYAAEIKAIYERWLEQEKAKAEQPAGAPEKSLEEGGTAGKSSALNAALRVLELLAAILG
ncbi:MAG: hypothetical protein SOY64_06350 [Pyramidobacter sp.]|uniref:hypothetical protein n=1 Tax=Pyramidobacter sp. TaxID=1943581 RepID=UPI002A7EAD86|nr:hypothetical protein [Pyramidobacter sp.]MDY4032666.1 hypothetical protein [Pyramidobacter sp.]